jgi:two-component system cell cycle response regulator DivK
MYCYPSLDAMTILSTRKVGCSSMSITILYIEDNPLNMRLVRKILNSFGYNIIEAMDGLTGLDMVERERPDLILLEINLPDIDGLEITTRLKSDESLRNIPVVALTANAMHGDRERCLEAGCDGYIAKPVAKLELKNTIIHFLGQLPDITKA